MHNRYNAHEVKVPQSCQILCDPTDYIVQEILQARILKWVAFPFSRGSFPTQESNPGLLHCRQVLSKQSLQGSPRTLDWVTYPFSSGSSWPRNWTGSPALQADSLPAELPSQNHSPFNQSVEKLSLTKPVPVPKMGTAITETFIKKRKGKKSEITMYFHEVTPNVRPFPASPSTTSTSSASATLENTRPTSLPPPLQPTGNDNEDEDLYDDSLPLNE